MQRDGQKRQGRFPAPFRWGPTSNRSTTKCSAENRQGSRFPSSILGSLLDGRAYYTGLCPLTHHCLERSTSLRRASSECQSAPPAPQCDERGSSHLPPGTAQARAQPGEPLPSLRAALGFHGRTRSDGGSDERGSCRLKTQGNVRPTMRRPLETDEERRVRAAPFLSGPFPFSSRAVPGKSGVFPRQLSPQQLAAERTPAPRSQRESAEASLRRQARREMAAHGVVGAALVWSPLVRRRAPAAPSACVPRAAVGRPIAARSAAAWSAARQPSLARRRASVAATRAVGEAESETANSLVINIDNKSDTETTTVTLSGKDKEGLLVRPASCIS